MEFKQRERVMQAKQHLLVVVNSLSDKEVQLIREVVSSQTEIPIKLSALCILPKIPTCYFQLPSAIGLASYLFKDAERKLSRLALRLGVTEPDSYLRNCSNRMDLTRIAAELRVSAIVSNKSDGYGIAQTVQQWSAQAELSMASGKIPCIDLGAASETGPLLECLRGISRLASPGQACRAVISENQAFLL
jgi:hypothetical protein